jgi:hypothetical protein
MQDITRKVIGIDPASGKKGSYVFAPGVTDPREPSSPGIDRSMQPWELRDLLPSPQERTDSKRKPFGTDSCLVCWDAPLTGQRHPDMLDITVLSEEEQKKESLTTRAIERTGEKALKIYREIADAATKPGVSVRGFSGLSHWVISRNVLGLPRVGRFDAEYEQLPLQPVFYEEQLAQPRYEWAVTEVHPTLAVYLWLKGKSQNDEGDWRQYKGNGKDSDRAGAVQGMWRNLWKRFESYMSLSFSLPDDDHSLPKDEDAFDARIAWLLGFLWLNSDEVKLVGNEKDGSFLLPKGVANSD